MFMQMTEICVGTLSSKPVNVRYTQTQEIPHAGELGAEAKHTQRFSSLGKVVKGLSSLVFHPSAESCDVITCLEFDGSQCQIYRPFLNFKLSIYKILFQSRSGSFGLVFYISIRCSCIHQMLQQQHLVAQGGRYQVTSSHCFSHCTGANKCNCKLKYVQMRTKPPSMFNLVLRTHLNVI